MKINGSISILADYNGNVTITLEDSDAVVAFAEVKMTHQEFVNASMNRLVGQNVEIDVRHLGVVGKKRVHKTFEFELPPIAESLHGDDRENCAYETGKKLCPEGWLIKKYFRSQGSYFMKDGVMWARTTIYRWETHD